MDDCLPCRLLRWVLGVALSVSASLGLPGQPGAAPGATEATPGPAPAAQSSEESSEGPSEGTSPADPDEQSDLAERAEELADQLAEGPPPDSGPVPAWAPGYDISWPQCPVGMGIPERPTLGKPLPPPGSLYVVIGLTNGPAFYPNPCLADQVAYAREHLRWASAYAVVTFPTGDQQARYGGAGPFAAGERLGRLRNTGYAQAQVNVRWMREAGLASPYVWLDVEPVRPPAPWSSDPVANRAVVEGAMRGYRDAGLRTGVYSTPYLWGSIVGDVDYGLPEWRAAGPTSRERAKQQCSADSIQGGPPVLGQWTNTESDFNVLCPGRATAEVLAEFFTPL